MNEQVSTAERIIALDVGNTRVGIGLWDDDGLHAVERFGHDDADGWAASLARLWTLEPTSVSRAVVMGSVNPDVARKLASVVSEQCDVEPVLLRTDIPLPLALQIENTKEVGVDRVCAAAAAYDRIGTACAVASFGTATTIDCVAADGTFLGGAILPGLDPSCEALHTRTAKLPRVSPGAPVSVLGKNTYDAILAGVVYGTAGALREIVERFAEELGQWPQLVVTGGAAPLIIEQVDFIDSYVPDLCLMGIALAYRKAAGQTQ